MLWWISGVYKAVTRSYWIAARIIFVRRTLMAVADDQLFMKNAGKSAINLMTAS